MATLDERLDLIAAQGIDVGLVLVVTPEFLAQEPEDFVREVLVERLGAAVHVLGAERDDPRRVLAERLGHASVPPADRGRLLDPREGPGVRDDAADRAG